MDTSDKNIYRDRLINERRKLNNVVRSLQSENILSKDQDSTELSSYANHPSDQGAEMFEMEKNLALEENEKVIMDKIDNSLEAMNDGTYGVCKICGKPISKERLETIPYADCCIDCQREFNSSYNGEKRPVEENYIDYTFGYDRNEQSAEYGMRECYADVSMPNYMPMEDEYDNYSDEDNEGFVEPIEKISNEQYKNQLP